jgi:N-hydroxyarylamine O-acetyltransferase
MGGMNRVDTEAYLARIGASAEDPLSVLVDRHLHAVPFETLSIHLGEPIVLDPDALFDKIVVRRRGGFCHELNGMFAVLLREFGYEVDLLAAGVADGAGSFTAPLAHVALRVGSAPAPFGDLDVSSAGGELAYRVELRPRRREDFVPTCWWQETSPDAPFTHAPLCSLPVDGGRVTLTGTTLVRTAADGTRTETALSDDDALAAYRDLFGVALDRLPTPRFGAG